MHAFGLGSQWRVWRVCELQPGLRFSSMRKDGLKLRFFSSFKMLKPPAWPDSAPVCIWLW